MIAVFPFDVFAGRGLDTAGLSVLLLCLVLIAIATRRRDRSK